MLRQAQEGGLGHTSYESALDEIHAGHKRTHWIWYCWPTLKALRPDTTEPQFLLPDFAPAVELLNTPVLADRLEELSMTALKQLRKGTSLEVLMNGGTDAAKFRESLTLFAMAAAVGRHIAASRQLDLFCLCLEALSRAPSPILEHEDDTEAKAEDRQLGMIGGGLLFPRAVTIISADATAPAMLHTLTNPVRTSSLRRLSGSADTMDPINAAECQSDNEEA